MMMARTSVVFRMPVSIFADTHPCKEESYGLSENSNGFVRCFRSTLHCGCERRVHVRPGCFHVGCERVAQAFPQCPRKRFSNCAVIFVSNSVVDVSCAKRPHHWQKLVDPVKTVDRESEHLH